MRAGGCIDEAEVLVTATVHDLAFGDVRVEISVVDVKWCQKHLFPLAD